jgi:hypothetical protein
MFAAILRVSGAIPAIWRRNTNTPTEIAAIKRPQRGSHPYVAASVVVVVVDRARKARRAPNSPRGIFIGTVANIAGMTVRDTLLAQRQMYDPHSHQCARLHNPQVEAALTGEESPERNVVMRHVSRPGAFVRKA